MIPRSMDWLYRWAPQPVISSYGNDIDGLFTVIYWITCVAFLLVMGLLAFFLVKYRHREGRRAHYTHGNNALEIFWTSVPAIILIWLAFHSQTLWQKIRGTMPPGDLHVVAVGKQFNWLFFYPGPDGKLAVHGTRGPDQAGPQSEDDLQVTGVLDVPVGKVVRLSVQSQDVIHSLFIPNMRMKQDALPGRSVEIWFKADRPGTYEIACAELCGMAHATMRAVLKVHDEASYAAWLKEHPNAFPATSSPTTPSPATPVVAEVQR